jgi:transposase
MIDPEKRKAIFLLHQEGMSVREIARRLHVSRQAVTAIIAQKGQMPEPLRATKNEINPELLRRLYAECEGWIQRMHEKLAEEHLIKVKYSTLTRMLRNLGISTSPETRCSRVPDEPGAEMQHDTTVYQVKLGDQTVRLVATLLYLRYSKRRYLKFYRTFNRFRMKCFLHEALTYWGYAAGQCIIDNTNLARLRGTGAQAVMVAEMEVFAQQCAFQFVCHEKGHPDRKAGEERSFWTTETNFLPGRSFQDLEDLNRQALEWATVRIEHECRYLTKLSAHLPAPYKVLSRGTDQYGFVAFDGNYYWVPGTKRQDVKVLQYSDRLKIYLARVCLVEYPLPAEGVHNQRFSPPHLPPPPHQPRHRTLPAHEEEKRLRALAPELSAYLDFALAIKGVQRHAFLRRLLTLSRKMTPALFIQSVQRAHHYRITNLESLERIALLYLRESDAELPLADIDESFLQRAAYQEGALTDLPDLSLYQEPEESTQTDPPEDPENPKDHE